jgi:hypothetical protein
MSGDDTQPEAESTTWRASATAGSSAEFWSATLQFVDPSLEFCGNVGFWAGALHPMVDFLNEFSDVLSFYKEAMDGRDLISSKPYRARPCARPATLDHLSGPGDQSHTTGVDDFYNELAHDYEWLFPDEAIGSAGTVGATSPGSKAALEGILNTLPRDARVLDCA